MREKQKELDSLFEEWQEWWNNPEYEAVYTKKPKCCFEHKNYKGRRDWFFPDGFLGDKELCEILFISKESHEEGKPQNDNNMDFWMRRMVSGIYKEGDRGKKGILYPRRMAAIYNAIYNKLSTKYGSECNYMEDDFSKLENCGYMNLNKHGGKAKTPPKPFEGLVIADNKKIKQQIIIMKPKKIVLLGADLPNLFSVIISNDEEFENFIKDKTIYVADHPAAFISYDNYKKRLRKLTLKRNEEGVLQWNESKE